MKSTYEQILHLLNLDLTPVCKGAFCCPLHSHASVFSVSEQTGTSRALDGKLFQKFPACVSGYDSSACLILTQIQITMLLHKVREVTNRR